METLTVESDESEGTQSISLDFINACSPDYTPMEEPAMTVEEIQHMLHLDDSKIFPKGKKDLGIYPINKKPSEIDSSLGDDALIDREKEPDDDDFDYPENDVFDKIAQAIINDKSIGPMDVIVEFAQPCIRDENGVDYKLIIKPG